jgi:hypothetical protein
MLCFGGTASLYKEMVSSRANRKIFNEKSAQTLKAGLLQLIKAN